MSKGVILLAAGGTGGHLFPAEALAHELKARGWSVHLVTDSRAERFAGRFPADAIHTVRSATLGSKNPVALVKSFLTLWGGFREASVVINRLKPAAVIGFGGYPTLPPLFAASRRGVPTLIHEQNAVMGRANKALAGRVDAIAGGFLAKAGPFAGKIVQTGNPVRPDVVVASELPYEPPVADGPFNLLVFGGSQGAQFFGQAMPQAIANLPEALRLRINLVQQVRAEDMASARTLYDGMRVKAELSPFFTDMAQRIAAAHLVISRSGASTVSELAAIGRPAIFVPYPHALDHDQAANASAMAQAGGAEVHRQETLSAPVLGGLIRAMMEDPQKLARMAAAARSAGRPEATRLLADRAEAVAARAAARTSRKD